MATTTARRNRRTDRSAELNARPQLVPVPDPSDAGATAPGRSATGDNGGGHQPKAQPKPAATPKPKPEPKLSAQVDLGARQVTYWFPVATLADGSQVSCPHSKYGHESEKAAGSCIRALVASKGQKVA